MSTIYPSLAGSYIILARLDHIAHGCVGELDTLFTEIPHTHLVTGPVFGPPAAADAGTLVVILAGEYRAKKEVAHILVPGVGKKAMDLGGNLEKGRVSPSEPLYSALNSIALSAPIFKLIGNSMILGSLEILAEAFTLSEKTGIGSATTYELVKDLFPAPPCVPSVFRIV